jgi:hypothetical protein
METASQKDARKRLHAPSQFDHYSVDVSSVTVNDTAILAILQLKYENLS